MKISYFKITEILFSITSVWFHMFDGKFSNHIFFVLLSGWTHIAVNYIGPDNGQGFRLYRDGVLAQIGFVKQAGGYTSANNTMRLGQLPDNFYGDIVVDELLFFNKVLNETFISQLASETG